MNLILVRPTRIVSPSFRRSSSTDDSFKYVREIVGEGEAMLEFVVELDGIHVNGVDIITWNENNQITDFKVMVRPFKAIDVIRERMVQGLKSL